MKAIDALPDWVDDEPRHHAEVHLIRLAGDYNLDDLKRLANRIIEVIDPDGADQMLGEQVRREEQNAWEATRLSIEAPRRRHHTRHLHDSLTPTRTPCARRSRASSPHAVPTSTPLRLGMDVNDFNALPRDHKMGHAFIELFGHLPTEALPKAGGLAATVAVTIDIDDLRTGQGTATNTSGTTTSATHAQRLACNAHLVALYLDSESKVLDHGTARRLYDRHQRLALAVRDQGCIWPGCSGGTPAKWRVAAGDGRPPGAKPITSTSGPRTGPPTSTMLRWSAISTTSCCTKVNGPHAWPTTASSRSSLPPGSTRSRGPPKTRQIHQATTPSRVRPGVSGRSRHARVPGSRGRRCTSRLSGHRMGDQPTAHAVDEAQLTGAGAGTSVSITVRVHSSSSRPTSGLPPTGAVLGRGTSATSAATL